jgi:hypothetical protein
MDCSIVELREVTRSFFSAMSIKNFASFWLFVVHSADQQINESANHRITESPFMGLKPIEHTEYE